MHKHSSDQRSSSKSTLCSRDRVPSVSMLFLFLYITSGLPSLVSAGGSNPNPFIVVFKQIQGNTSSIDDHLNWIHKIDKNTTNPSSVDSNGAIGNFQWYSGKFDSTTLAQINSSDVVEYVIEDVTFKIQEQVQSRPPSWGLDRIDQRTGTDGNYHFPSSEGEGVDIYIIDTGVNIYHQDLIGRAYTGPSFNSKPNSALDPNGHGTFVAGICCGDTYGVAKKANVISVKALDADGSGLLSNVLSAIDWVVQQYTSGVNNKTIVNLSLGADHNDATNQAIEQAIAQGIHFAIAAGNDGKDACDYSPASVVGAMTVGATSRNDSIASYSNTGSCVNIYAPGTSINSIWNTTNSSTYTLSGTSMASPHVAGAMALILGTGDYTPPELISKILTSASTIATSTTNVSFVYVDAVDNLAVVMFKDTGVMPSSAVGLVTWKGRLSWLAYAALMAGIAFCI